MAAQPDSNTGVQTINLTFAVPGRPAASLRVTLKPNTDTSLAITGQRLLFPSLPPSTFIGFPLCRAQIQCQSEAGYASNYGWIQMTRDGSSPAAAEKASWEMDPVPIFASVNSPFVGFGPEGQLYDAPSREDHVKELDWTAWSFLGYVEDCLLTRKTRPVLAFEWGFWIQDGKKTVKSLRLLNVNDAWKVQKPMLEAKYPEWTFLDKNDDVKIVLGESA